MSTISLFYLFRKTAKIKSLKISVKFLFQTFTIFVFKHKKSKSFPTFIVISVCLDFNFPLIIFDLKILICNFLYCKTWHFISNRNSFKIFNGCWGVKIRIVKIMCQKMWFVEKKEVFVAWKKLWCLKNKYLRQHLCTVDIVISDIIIFSREKKTTENDSLNK